MIRRRDKLRADHYRYYTDEKWGASTNYHLCLDSSVFGIEKCVSIIEDACKGMYVQLHSKNDRNLEMVTIKS